MVKDESAEDGEDEGHSQVSQEEEEPAAMFLVVIGSEEGVLKPDPACGVENLKNDNDRLIYHCVHRLYLRNFG